MNPINRFQQDFFAGNNLALTNAEKDLVIGALGRECQRWQGYPDIERMKNCLDANPTVLDRIGSGLLNTIIGIKGCGPAVKFLLDHDTPFHMEQDIYNTMHEGAWCNAVDSLEALFESGVVDATCVSVKKPHVGWPDNISLMYWAATRGYPEMAELLIKYGVGKHHELEIKGNGERGATSLQEAVAPPQGGTREARLQIARLLIADGAYYDIGSACSMNDPDRVSTLLENNPNLADEPLHFDMTPLHWSSRAGSVDTTELLLTHEVDPNAVNQVHRTPIHMAAEAGHEEVVALLADAGADLNPQDKKGRTPLHRATYEGQLNAAEKLMVLGADTTIENEKGKTAFEIARKEAKVLKELA